MRSLASVFHDYRRALRVCSCGGLALVISMALTSCGHSLDRPKPSPAVARPNLAKVDASLDTIAAEQTSAGVSELALQSERDVQAILAARNAGSAGHSLASSSHPQSLPAPPPLGAAGSTTTGGGESRQIVWNGATTKRQPATAVSLGQPSNANADQDDRPRQSPLFKPLDEPEPSPPSDSATVNASATTRPSLEPDRLRQLMVDLSRELYATGAYSEAPLRQLMMIAAMSMIDPERQLQPQAIPDLTEKERDLLGKLQAFFAALGKSLDGSDDPESAIVDAVARLRESIVREPQLKLATIALCTRVTGYGDYSEFDKLAFLALAEQKAIVYLEIEDFTSQLNSKGDYVTEISQQLTIYNVRDGIPVWRGDWQAAVDVTRNKRQDFFTVQVITLPKALSVGKYTLKVRVRDEKSGAEAENSVEFEMVADPKMAAIVK